MRKIFLFLLLAATLGWGQGVIELRQIKQSGATSGQVPKWDGTKWVPGDDTGGSVFTCSSGTVLRGFSLDGSPICTGLVVADLDAAGEAAGYFPRVSASSPTLFEWISPADVRSVIQAAAASHQAQHQWNGSDSISSETAGANLIPRASSSGKLLSGWGTEVWSATDLTTWNAVSGTGTTAIAGTFSSLAVGHCPVWNGTNWVNQSCATADAVLGASALTHVGDVPFVGASGSITASSVFSWDNVSKTLTILAGGGDVTRLSLEGDLGLTRDTDKITIGAGATMQAVLDNDAGYIRALFGSNLAWNPSTNVFDIRPNGGNDYTGIYVENGGGIGFSLETGLSLPTTRTVTQFRAGTKLWIDPSGKVGVGTLTPVISGTGKFHASGNTSRMMDALRTPSSGGDTSNTGEFALDASNLYLSTGSNTWRKIPHYAFTADPPVTSASSPSDDTVLVGSGSGWVGKSIPNCVGGTKAINYDASTNLLSCATVSASGDGIANYSKPFSSSTLVTIAPEEHGLGHGAIMVQVFDEDGVEFRPDYLKVDPLTFEVTVGFLTAKDGLVVLSGWGGPSLPEFSIYYAERAPYLATGDGTTDDSAAIQAAVDAAEANGGGIVKFGCGTFKIVTPIEFAGNNITIQGTNMGCTVFVAAANPQNIFNVGTTTGYTSLNVRDVKFYGGASLNTGKAISMTTTGGGTGLVSNSSFRNVEIDHYKYGFYGDRIAETIFKDIWLSGDNTGFGWIGSTIDGASGYSRGITIDGVYQRLNSTFSTTSYPILQFDRVVDSSLNDIRLPNIPIGSGEETAILLTNGTEGIRISNILVLGAGYGIALNETTVGSTTIAPRWVDMDNVHVDSFDLEGIRLNKSQHITIAHSLISTADATALGCRGIYVIPSGNPKDDINIVAGNKFDNWFATGGSCAAVWIAPGVKHLNISDNFFDSTASGSKSIHLDTGATDDYNIYGNNFKLGVGASHISNNATGTYYSVFGNNPNVPNSFGGTITSPGFVGPLTGNVTGNVTGNLTGNVTGNTSGTAASTTTKEVQIVVTDFATSTATGDGQYYFVVPVGFNGLNLVAVHGQVITVGTTNTTDVQLARCAVVATGSVCSGTVVDMLSTKLTIDSNEDDSSTAASAAVINTSNDDVATNQVIRVDVDAVSTTPAKGLILTLKFQP